MNFPCNPLNTKILPAVLISAVFFTGCGSSGDTAEQTASNPLFMQQYDRAVSRTSDTSTSLVNGNFEQPLGNLPGWSACVDDNALSHTINTGSIIDISNVEVAPGECILQAIKVNPEDNHTLSCFLTTRDSDQWSGMAIAYYDAAGNFLAESDVALVDWFQFRRKAASAAAPANADVALAWFYTDSGGNIADCEFQTMSSVEPVGQNYRKTLNVERQFGYNRNFSTIDGFIFNG